MPITIHTDTGNNHLFPLYLQDNSSTGRNTASFWFPEPVPLATVRNTTNRLKDFTMTIFQQDGRTPAVWTDMSIWFLASTPSGDFGMKKTNIRTIRDPSYYDKQLGQEDVENVLYR